MNTDIVSRAITFIHSWLRFRSAYSEIPGFAVGISVDGQLVFNEAYGFANLEKKELLTSQHLFRVASHSKTFTGIALMQLQEGGKIDIDAPLSNLLPWLKTHKDKRVTKLTASQLLSHSAGMIRDGIDADYWQLTNPFPDEAQLKTIIQDCDLVLENNKQMKYSNIGYGLLGLAIEKASGESFASYVNSNIIKKLGLSNTGPEFLPNIANRLVMGYSRLDETRQRTPLSSSVDTRALAAATGFYSTVADLCTYFTAQFPGNDQLIDDESKKEMQRTHWVVTNTRMNQQYGLGLQIDYEGERRLFGHAGAFPGQATRTLCDPKEKMVVTVLTNCIDADPTAIVRGIYSIFDHFKLDELQKISPENEELKRFEGRFNSIWSTTQVLRRGSKLIAINPNNWQPFTQEIEDLERVDAQTLKVTRADGFSCEGELVHYDFDKTGNPKSIRYGGLTRWTEEDYGKTLTKLKAAAIGAKVTEKSD